MTVLEAIAAPQNVNSADITLVNVADLSPVTEAFIDLPTLGDRPIHWHRHSGLPQNSIERKVRRPRLSRYRAAFGAARDSRSADAIISHLPRMTAAVAEFGRLVGKRTPHLAFSFNFTSLPGAAQRARMSAAFARVDQFCVYSQFEAGRYADAFGLDPVKFRPVLWTQQVPRLATTGVPAFGRPYIVAVGGEGRDFATLMAAARRLPMLDFVVIARPTAELADAPANVTIHFNLPAPVCWAIAAGADALVVPLIGPETCCGHVTLVSARMLGIPIITSASIGTRDYTAGFPATHVIPHADADALAGAITALRDDLPRVQALAQADRITAEKLYDRTLWRDYVAAFLTAELGL